MQAGDGLPELMCVPCVLQVSRAFTFKQQCQRSDQTLRSHLGEIDKIDSAPTDFIETNSNADVSDIQRNVIKVEKLATNPFSAIDETSTNQLNSQLDLDTLPAEIESNAFEDDIELSNLPDSVADDDIHGKSPSPSKFGDYFDEIKLDVGHAVALTENELPVQEMAGTFGEHINKILKHSSLADSIN